MSVLSLVVIYALRLYTFNHSHDHHHVLFNNTKTHRYISDFPDDLLWDHNNSVILPHLGASTYEAEDAAASMAAETIRDFLETGTIRNSVNFPATSLSQAPENSIRFTVVTKNTPGMLAHISEVFAAGKLNILQQINQSRGDVAYNVVDVDISGGMHVDFALAANVNTV